MNTLTKGVAATVLAGTAITFGASAASAAPVHHASKKYGYTSAAKKNPNVVTTGIMPGVTYTGNSHSGATELKTPWGTVSTAPGKVAVSDNAGRSVFGNPSKVQSPLAGPVKAATNTVDGFAPGARQSALNKATGAPQWQPPIEVVRAFQPQISAAMQQLAPKQSSTTKAAAPKKMTQDEKSAAIQSAIGVVGTNFGLAYGVGAMVGGVGGAVIGCPIGAVAMTLAVPIAVGVDQVLGCLVGAGTFGTTGAIIGGAVLGAPVGVATAVQQAAILQAQGAI
ncbi:MAG: hypothetical protein QM728_03550 [Gordonia sp. (in: high G+C Gram-positive bacteria)]|uniref:hypothetical protein n=1 Tax=Gordonia sp. (in: high G+C Gram-positive bacteria) TaxID=84139 RepID=UPI0039E70A7D